MDLNKIDTITLNSATIGDDVNARLITIDGNFDAIKNTINGRSLFTSNTVSRYNLDNSLQTKIEAKFSEHGFTLGTYTLTIFSNADESIKYFNATGIPFTIANHQTLGVQYLTISGEYSNIPSDTPDESPTKDWKISVHNTPVIYYDSASQSYCWQLGDTRTGISARGVKGDKGDSTTVESLKVVQGTLDDTKEPKVINISAYYGLDSQNKWGWKDSVADLSGGTPAWCNIGNEFYSGVVAVGSDTSRAINNPVKITLVEALTTDDIDKIWDEVF